MGEIVTGVNWLAVGVGAALAYGLGWLWYSPRLFGVQWAKAVGITLDPPSGPPALAMATQAIGTFLLAWVIGVTAVAEALLTAILVILTLMALIAAGGLFSQKSAYAIGTETGYVAVMAVIMIICQGVF